MNSSDSANDGGEGSLRRGDRDKNLEHSLTVGSPYSFLSAASPQEAIHTIQEAIPENLDREQLDLLKELLKAAERNSRYAFLTQSTPEAGPQVNTTLSPYQAALARAYWSLGLLRKEEPKGIFGSLFSGLGKWIFRGWYLHAQEEARLYRAHQIAQVDAIVAKEYAQRMERIAQDEREKEAHVQTKLEQHQARGKDDLERLKREIADKEKELDLLDKAQPISTLRQRLSRYEGDIRLQLLEDLVFLELPRWYETQFDLVKETAPAAKDPLYFTPEEQMRLYVRALFTAGSNLKIGPLHAPAGKEGEYESYLRSILPAPLINLVSDAENQVDKVYMAVLEYILGTRIPSNPKMITVSEYETFFTQAIPKEKAVGALTILRDSHLRLLDALADVMKTLSEEHQSAWRLIKETSSAYYGCPQLAAIACTSFEDYLAKAIPILRSKASPKKIQSGVVLFVNDQFGIMPSYESYQSAQRITYIFNKTGKAISGQDIIYSENSRVVCLSREEFEKDNKNPDGTLANPGRWFLEESEIKQELNAIIDRSLSAKDLSRATANAKLQATSGISKYHPTLEVERLFREKWYNAVIQRIEQMYQPEKVPGEK